jgi:hypothetical protein
MARQRRAPDTSPMENDGTNGQSRPRRRRTATRRRPGPRRGGDKAPRESTRRGGYRVRQGRPDPDAFRLVRAAESGRTRGDERRRAPAHTHPHRPPVRPAHRRGTAATLVAGLAARRARPAARREGAGGRSASTSTPRRGAVGACC